MRQDDGIPGNTVNRIPVRAFYFLAVGARIEGVYDRTMYDVVT